MRTAHHMLLGRGRQNRPVRIRQRRSNRSHSRAPGVDGPRRTVASSAAIGRRHQVCRADRVVTTRDRGIPGPRLSRTSRASRNAHAPHALALSQRARSTSAFVLRQCARRRTRTLASGRTGQGRARPPALTCAKVRTLRVAVLVVPVQRPLPGVGDLWRRARIHSRIGRHVAVQTSIIRERSTRQSTAQYRCRLLSWLRCSSRRVAVHFIHNKQQTRLQPVHSGRICTAPN